MQITTLLTGADVVTTYIDPQGCEQYIVVGDPDTTMPLKGLLIEIEGVPTINIVGSNTFMSVLAKWMNNFCGTVIGLIFQTGTGFIGKKTKYSFTNNGATTPAIYAFSEASQGIPFRAVTTNVNALSLQRFTNFSGLFIAVANVQQFIVEFADGTNKILSVIEADTLFARKNQTEANGRIDGNTTGFDNRDQSITAVSVQSNATAAGVAVMIVNFTGTDWASLKKLAAAQG